MKKQDLTKVFDRLGDSLDKVMNDTGIIPKKQEVKKQEYYISIKCTKKEYEDFKKYMESKK